MNLKDKIKNIVENIDTLVLTTKPDSLQSVNNNINIKRKDKSLSTLNINVKKNGYAVGIDGKNKGNILTYLENNFELNNENTQNKRYKVSPKEIESVIKYYAGVKKEKVKKENKVLFCRIASMKYYQNMEDDTATGGGSYIEDNPAHERFNFKKQDGVFYGFAQSSETDGGVNLARIDNNIQENAQPVDGVLVIFVADSHIVGYYKNATVYGEIQNADNYDKGDYSAYNIRAKKAVLLSPSSRNYKIHQGKGAMGQSNIYYIYDENGNLKQEDWIQHAVNYVQINNLVKSYIPVIVSYCNQYPNELKNLTSNNFDTTSYPLLKTVSEIEQHDAGIKKKHQTWHGRYWKEEYQIANQKYRFHSQWASCGVWNTKISSDEKHRNAFIEYLKEKKLYENINNKPPESINKPVITDETQKIIDLLRDKKQIILQGSPGTGKTYLAKQIAKHLALDNNKLIQFHPAYSYEDFVRGIVAKTNEGNISYEVENKILAEIAARAQDDENNAYILIIDEINRANLSAVLGELIYALEYRGEAVESMYALDGERKITLPENLYIIGTMNTADRSVGHIDYAIRRRFSFVNIPTDRAVIEEKNPNNIMLFDKINSLFDEYLSSEFDKDDVMIGHSYFLTKKIKQALEYEIKPILFEYLKDGILTCEKSNIENLDAN